MAYISNKLTHWIGRKEKSSKGQYRILKEILKKKLLLFGNSSWSLNKKYPDLKVKKLCMISFTDIPLSESERHCKKYSKFGISFNKTYLANCHATPVGYMQNPWIEGNITFTLKALKALKDLLRSRGIRDWSFCGFRGKKIKETARIDSIQSLLKTFLLTTEDYSGKHSFKYNETETTPLSGQEKLFEDPNALYFEREWRINYTTLFEEKLKHHIVKKRNGKKYLKFDEKYMEYIIIPKNFIVQFAKDRKTIFSAYKDKNIPKVIAYEDLKYI